MIRVAGLEKSFGGRPAVRGVSFSVARGEILGFLGPNGAGKTTTMRILTCYLPPDAGRAEVDGLDVFEQSMEVRRRIGYLPETPPLYPEMLVRDYLGFVAKLRGIPRGRRRPSVDSAMERCGLGEAGGRLIGNLSKGFRQRVGLAQALVHEPPVLVLDEPTAGLDPEQIIEIRELIRSLGGEHTVILSTHILPEVAVTCTRAAIISYGEIVQEGSLTGLTSSGDDHVELRLRVARDSPAVREALSALPWSRRVAPGEEPGLYHLEVSRESRAREDLARLLVERGWGLLEMTPLTRSLEEIYLEATRKLPAEEAPRAAGDGGMAGETDEAVAAAGREGA